MSVRLSISRQWQNNLRIEFFFFAIRWTLNAFGRWFYFLLSRFSIFNDCCTSLLLVFIYQLHSFLRVWGCIGTNFEIPWFYLLRFAFNFSADNTQNKRQNKWGHESSSFLDRTILKNFLLFLITFRIYRDNNSGSRSRFRF